MELFGLNPNRVIDGYSEEFHDHFMEHLRRACAVHSDVCIDVSPPIGAVAPKGHRIFNLRNALVCTPRQPV